MKPPTHRVRFRTIIQLFTYLFIIMFVSSCSFEKQTFKSEHDTILTLSKSIRMHNPSAKNYLEKGTSVRVLGRYAEDREDGYIIETLDGERYTTTYLENVKGIPEQYVNVLHTHYVKDLLVKGQHIGNFIEKWGDYTECTTSWISDTKKRAYVFPQVSQVSKGQVSQGSKVITDQDGKIIDIYPCIEGHSNAFGKLPFFDDIISLNLQNAVKASYLVASPDEATQELGLVLGSIWGFIWLLIICAPISLLAFISFHLLQDHTKLPIKVLMGIICVISGVILYPLLLVLFNECHAVWWVLAVFASTLLGIYDAIYSSARVQCSICKSYNWDEKEEKDRRSNDIVAYPHMTVSRNAINDVVTEISFRKETKHCYFRTYTCRECGNVRYEKFYKSTVVYENNCPKCGTAKDTSFYRVKITSEMDTRIKGTYTERCPKCGYSYSINFDCPIQGRRILETATPRRRSSGNSSQAEKGEQYKNNCYHCKYYHESNGEPSCSQGYGKVKTMSKSSRDYGCPYWVFDGLD